MARMSVRGLSPFDGLLELQSALDRMLGSPALGGSHSTAGANVFPPINVFTDKEGAVVVRAEVPGVDPETLEVKTEAGRLTISGERKSAPINGSYHRRERQYGKFSRTVQLPKHLDAESTAADYKGGVLTVRVAKEEAAKPRRIEIRAA